METSQQLVSQKKYVYMFHEGNAQMKDLLGGKGANLAEMTRLGLPIPQGFTITTEACNAYHANGKQFPDGLKEQVEQALKELERITGKKFGDKENPLLVSVRSGAPVSMPGMMDTILNIGLNDETVEGLAKKTNNRRFALDCYRRLIQMFGNVVLKIDHEKFEKELERVKEIENVQYDQELSEQALSTVVNSFKRLVKQETGRDFPQDPMEQLYMAIKAVFDSWNNKRAIKYREVNKIPHNLGTAANVQVMVFGNMGENSGTGVAFTRNPANGNKELYGEYLMNAQGEDVVAGIRTPLPVSKLKEQNEELYNQFVEICDKLERHYRDMQDIEFTIEEGKLFILQTRTGKRTASAAVKIAVDMVKEGIIDKEEAIMRITPEQVDQLLHPRIDPNAHYEVLAKGLNASPGAASGAVVFDPDSAEKLAKSGKKVILVRPETTPEDIHGIVAAEGVLTSRGGATSHAAVVARGIGKPCVVGCEDIKIDLEKKRFTVGEIVVSEGDIITIDGSTGEVILGAVPLTHPELSEEFKTLLRWADDIRKLGVRANADTPEMAMLAIKFGAEGIGLCRTERMFNAPDRMPIMRAMIIAGSEEERKKQIEKLRPMQKEDFKEMLRIMGDRPMIVRLLDPPLHEFMPSPEELLNEIFVLKEKGKKDDDPEVVERKRLLKRVKELQEINPMLGHRGVRLGMTYPYIYEMQIRALLEAAAEVIKEGIKVNPEIMVPQVVTAQELKWVRKMVDRIKEEVEREYNVKIPLKFGTMMECVRACMRAEDLAKVCDFFSFGTNDLTQATFSFSREDAESKFLPMYTSHGILQHNPFQVLDVKGVGKLMQLAVEWGRKGNPNLEIGICGEHGGEPNSIKFCHAIGLDYVSCSPYRIPIARLVAAQASILEKRGEKLYQEGAD